MPSDEVSNCGLGNAASRNTVRPSTTRLYWPWSNRPETPGTCVQESCPTGLRNRCPEPLHGDVDAHGPTSAYASPAPEAIATTIPPRSTCCQCCAPAWVTGQAMSNSFHGQPYDGVRDTLRSDKRRGP